MHDFATVLSVRQKNLTKITSLGGRPISPFAVPTPLWSGSNALESEPAPRSPWGQHILGEVLAAKVAAERAIEVHHRIAVSSS